ncbi:TonB-linked outer membrane protein, SusC/RagA family [Pedobacter steynii]|uniref:TonB-linked outer membrane protein, SusC/RagA family n=1 Tax=Pedobacter steynii TaxID=430522 RepID=A0A1G9K3X0_9SPHI|nr:SusC/RagA family TonB-linked outer membrane protein [Pedobacter steynii]NQX38441.1 SusC/RagA family TonB-linked outer membrane protein [Pedobacter steynii]SDL44497.1 TonB-linked outer membrane protein, SusC/RagA family [Pedobacter steynii]
MKKTIPAIVLAALCFFFSNVSNAQTIQITGVITDQQGQTLSDATIQIVNQNIKTKSNKDGTFTITTTRSEGILKISYLGYKSKEVHFIGTQLKRLSILLEENKDVFKEVEINAGYYTVKEKERTGSISRITAETIEKQPVNNVLSAMAGRMAGVNIEQYSGINGGAFKVEIRGRNSLRNSSDDNGNQPLYLIDGVPYPATSLTSTNLNVEGISGVSSPLNYINPGDIESIEVLKDADATSIYGSRGANGVILIKTKRPKAGKSRLDLNYNTGISRVSSKLELLNTQQYLLMRNEAFKNDGASPVSTDYDINNVWDKDAYTDWQEQLIGGVAKSSNIQFSVNGGNELTQFSFRSNYSKFGTVTPGNFSDRKGSGSLAVHHNSIDGKLKMSFSANYLNDKNELPRQDLTQFIKLPPNAPALTDTLGNLNWALNSEGASTFSNPLAATKQPYLGKTNNFISQVSLDYEVLNGLKLIGRFGYTKIHLREQSLTPISSMAPSIFATGAHTISSSQIETWIVEPQLSFKRKIGDGDLNVLLGGTFQSDAQNAEGIFGFGYTDDLLLKSIDAAPGKYANSTSSEYKYNAIFGRVNYNYKSTYMINLTGRRDGSSRFGPGKQYANFGAIGMAWIFTNANFIRQNLPFLSFGKLRGSYGITGSDQISNYGYLQTYSATQPYQDGTGLFPTRIANPDYSWETNKKLEVAIDLGFMGDKIILNAGYYRNRSSNQLVGYTLPDIVGFSSIQYNLPATVQNSGWEFELNTTNIRKSSFSWKSAITLTIPKNRLLSYPNIEGSTYVNIFTVGESLYTPKTLNFLGVNPNSGLYFFEDLNNNNNDVEQIDRSTANKSLASHWYGGLQNSLTYRNFSLDLFFQFVNKTSRYPFAGTFSTPGTIGNQPIEVMNRWQHIGDKADIQKFSQAYTPGGADTKAFYRYYSNSFINASFIRIKNLALSWNAPSPLVKKMNVGSLRLYIQGQNLVTITKYPGDPEVDNMLSLPSLRTITAGIQIGI